MKDDVRKHLEILQHETDMCLQRDFVHLGFCNALFDVIRLVALRGKDDL